MGDFYELFFDDAVDAAGALDITLTKRGKHKDQEIPMCGVPFHAYESYLERLIRQGFTVAICEQMEAAEEAKKRGYKAVVERDIVRIVTPGTLTEDTLLDARRNNFLGALSIMGGGAEAALSAIDLSTGEFFVRTTTCTNIRADLANLSLSELIIPDLDDMPDEWRDILDILRDGDAYNTALTWQPASYFNVKNSEHKITDIYEISSLDAYGQFDRAEISAMGAILSYIDLTQAGKIPVLRAPKRQLSNGVMAIDGTTRLSLELHQTQSGSRKGALIHAIDRTITGPGARALSARIAAPLTDPERIAMRLDEIDFFLANEERSDDIRALLKTMPDMARNLSRLSLDRGGPRDMVAILKGLQVARSLADNLHQSSKSLPDLKQLPTNLQTALFNLDCQSTDYETSDKAQMTEGFSKLINLLKTALVDDVPMLARDGGFIAKNYDPGLDEIRSLRDESRRVMAGLETQYREKSGIKALKVRQNNVLGFFIEVPTSHGDKMMQPPLNEHFIHRQTLASAVRFTTGELADLDGRISRARDEALARELEIYQTLLNAIMERAEDIRLAADAAARIDVAAAFAHLARHENYTRPVVDDSLAFTIIDGRHPVVEQALKKEGTGFIANDCQLSDGKNGQLWLMTGPNMAGKSTFLRQNALIAILAQAGGYVPAEKTHIGVADRVFSRVGASDDLARGRSTFMVEMVETAAILNQAGPQALVILDEIGRGTSTFDGLSIAWAAVEHLHDRNRCRGLFATHYHELTALEEQLTRLSNVSMKVREWKGDVVFLHEVGPGAADRSYGVAVARLAGVPAPVIKRAGEVLKMLEAQKAEQSSYDTLPLFANAPQETQAQNDLAANPQAPQTINLNTPLIDAVRALDPDNLPPRQALDKLYHLKSLIEEE